MKKALLNGVILLFVCFTAYAINQSFDLGDWPLSNSTPIHKCDSSTHTHEASVAHHTNYDKYVEYCIHKETGNYILNENIIYHTEANTSDLDSSFHTINNSNSTTHSYNDHSNDPAIETRKQEIEENKIAQTEAHNKPFTTTEKIIYELTIPKGTILYLRDIEGRTFDSTLILDKIHTIKDLIVALDSPIIKARFERIKVSYLRSNNPKKSRDHRSKNKFQLLGMLISRQITQILNRIMHPQLNVAQSAFDELKQLWPWKREQTFLSPDLKYGTGESGFTTTLGVDIMKLAEKSLITRPDYIAKHANAQKQKIIQKYKEKCYLLQQKGNSNDLFNQKQQLYRCIIANGNNNDLVTNVCLAITENCWLDPITEVLRSIALVPSLEKACDHLNNLAIQLLTQAQQQNITHVDQIRTWVINHYGFDVLNAAQNNYKSRADYISTAQNQSVLSDDILTIVDNIEHKDLPSAHAELIHLNKQINKIFEERNITDHIVQKEYIKKSFGKDALEVAHKSYEEREDHKKLVESFMPIDVNQATATILENNNTYESVANGMNDLAKHVFVNAHLCNLSNLPKIESHVYDSIDAMRTAQDHPIFIFNFSMVNHTLSDIQQLAHAIFSGRHPTLEKSSELLIRGFGTFLKGLDPVTHACNMGHLASDLGSLLKKGSSALWNDPITAIHNGITTTFTLTELIRNTADFTSDLTVGKLYLSPEECKQLTDAFHAMMEPLQGITAEQCTDFVAQIAADVVFFKGFGNAYNFLKEIDVSEKLSESAAAVARIFKKGFDTHLANNPILVTAEGVTIKMSDAMHNINNSGGGKNIINSTKALFESAYAEIAIKLEDKIEKIREFYLLNPQHDLPNFGNKHIKIALEHILGVELKWRELGTLLDLSGFHHDFMGAVEKSKVFQFVNKVIKENGCYSVDIVVDDKKFPKTFFPQHWSQKKVADKIYEAYYNFRKNGAIAPEKGGKYLIDGLTNEGITIRMFVTKRGEIVTAYPKRKP